MSVRPGLLREPRPWHPRPARGTIAGSTSIRIEQAKLAHPPRTTRASPRTRTADAAPQRKLTPTPGLTPAACCPPHAACCTHALSKIRDPSSRCPLPVHVARCPRMPRPSQAAVRALPTARASVALDPPRAQRVAQGPSPATRANRLLHAARTSRKTCRPPFRLLPGTRRTPLVMLHTAHYTGRSPLPARVRRISGHLKLIPSVLVAPLTRNPRFYCVLQYHALYLVDAPTPALWFCDAHRSTTSSPTGGVLTPHFLYLRCPRTPPPCRREEVSQDEGRGGEFLAAAPYFRTLPISNLTVYLTGNNKPARLGTSSASTALKVNTFDTLLFHLAYAYFRRPTPSNCLSSPRPSSTHAARCTRRFYPAHTKSLR
ncbi:hypothetical protein GGX14DRAFT_553459 [Mycena pura]|uniref:Uncharacterized protein n=1 Tax=Mycena pura TaxID=153505 RepID=A0AAD7E646_9AGAR|nr:hypothetical protein GGX14DRAFT_553459 [Mycena pura]